MNTVAVFVDYAEEPAFGNHLHRPGKVPHVTLCSKNIIVLFSVTPELETTMTKRVIVCLPRFFARIVHMYHCLQRV